MAAKAGWAGSTWRHMKRPKSTKCDCRPTATAPHPTAADLKPPRLTQPRRPQEGKFILEKCMILKEDEYRARVEAEVRMRPD